MKLSVMVFGTVMFFALYWMGIENQKAMAKCEAKGFSYDTCFSQLYP